ncbi:hypothetical protein AB751O23_AN_00130 [Chlamydiales bacterium SCGC AB-751-O23]|nr:hypothetical protein AB751O23_AN_00130 [Chlamydiales bacterium SCGC AB-751-O23]
MDTKNIPKRLEPNLFCLSVLQNKSISGSLNSINLI